MNHQADKNEQLPTPNHESPSQGDDVPPLARIFDTDCDKETTKSDGSPTQYPLDSPTSVVDQHEISALTPILEALLFASQKALSLKELLSLIKAAAASSPTEAPGTFSKIKEQEILEALQFLRHELSGSARAYELRETASGWQLVTKPVFAPWLRQLFPEARPSRLSAPALETLAIIAYRQPITRADVEAVRGVAVDGVVQTLLDRGLIHIAGRAEVPGKPLLYATSQFFLDHFGLRSLEELPNAVELSRMALPKAANPAATNVMAAAPTEELATQLQENSSSDSTPSSPQEN